MRQNPSRFWTLEEAIITCGQLEDIAPRYGAHVALTGGCLYKKGQRKDLDVLFYRIRQVERIDRDALIDAIEEELGIVEISKHGWVSKCLVGDAHVDFFFPDHVDRGPTQGEDYNGQVTDSETGTDNGIPF